MSRLVNAGPMTLTVDGIEGDHMVSAFVELSPSGAMVDGWVQVHVYGQPHDIDLLAISTDDVERATQLLCDQAYRDAADEADDRDDDSYERYCA